MDSKKMMEPIFIDQFNDYVSKTHREHEEAWNFIKKDFLRKTVQNQIYRIMETVGEHSRHVAWIRVKDNDRVISSGTFFLLTESLGVTCYDVVKDVPKSPGYSIEIRFAYTEIGAEDWSLPAMVETYSETFNYAYLRVTGLCPEFPGGLLRHLAPPPQDGAVAIIGHPQGQYKQIHVCSVINLKSREDSSPSSFVNVLPLCRFIKLLSSNETRLYEGASGAPMFNDDGELVAMYSGGYTVKASATTTTVIEYGRSMVEIIIMGAVDIKDLRREFFELVEESEALESYIFSGLHPPHMKIVITAIRELWKVERNNSPEDECRRLPLKLAAEFTIKNEDDLNKILKNCGDYISQRASILRRLTSPSSYDEKAQESSKPRGCYTCCLGTCEVCSYMKKGSSFSSYQIVKPYHMPQSINCNSSYVVYVISCTQCRLQYVGCTVRPLTTRIREHIREGRTAVSKHFHDEHQGNVQYLQFQGIQMIENHQEYKNSKRLLQDLEAIWIWRLKTGKPHGLNKKGASVRLHSFKGTVQLGDT